MNDKAKLGEISWIAGVSFVSSLVNHVLGRHGGIYVNV